jgi:hypothetical protein
MRKAAVALVLFGLLGNGCHRGAASQTSYASPQEAADALVQAASNDDVTKMVAILGSDGKDLVASADRVQDRNRAMTFAAKAREKRAIEIDPKDPARATLSVGNDNWPLPIPIVMRGGKWSFDTEAGHDEVLLRRIGANELDVITILRGYDEAQQKYATELHDGATVNQYARRIISTPGKHDGLAWKNPDGSWGGPVGQAAAAAMEQGYGEKKPFHGYYFRILEGQGPSARLGKLDYVVDGAMIGGFGLVAWPAEYEVTGVQTFITSYDGAVYQKDLGPKTAEIASTMDRYDPDDSWKRTDDGW